MDYLVAAQADASELRAELPIPYILEMYGHHPARESHGRLHYYSPFREDKNPSFDVFTHNGVQRWGDFGDGSGTQGSVIDLVQRLEDCDTGTAFGICREWYSSFVGDGWDGPSLEAVERVPFDRETAEATLLHTEPSTAVAALNAFLVQAVHTHPVVGSIPARRLREEWDISAEDGAIAIPYYNQERELIGVRYRRGEKKWFAKGSEMGLYGVHKLRSDYPIFLCEGESDAWAAREVIGDEYDVLAVPGTGHRPEKLSGVEVLDGRTVYLAFDGDDAGRAATVRWAAHLAANTATVFVVPLPSGTDVGSLEVSKVRALPGRARPLQIGPDHFAASGGCYVKLPYSENGNAKPVSNWTLKTETLLVGNDGGLGFGGLLRPHNREVVLPIESLSSTGTLVRWCNTNGVVWTGGAGDHQRLLQLLLHDATFLPEGRMTRQAGYHEGDFVWPDGHIGTEDWTYVPPPAKINLEGLIHIGEGPGGADPYREFCKMLAMHRPDITTPFLAWLAAAPLRPLFSEFPILSISGGSGTGKTTLTERLLRGFSGSEVSTNLTSTTPYAVTSFFASCNAIPVWFDEYRPGAREDAKNQLDQLLRDSYTGQPSYKGGLTDNKAEVTMIPTTVPVVVTGEESFIETSHTDRMVLIRLTKDGRGPLAPLYDGFVLRYLHWLVRGGQDGRVHAPVLRLLPSYEGLNDRQQRNLSVLDFGWRLLGDFFADISPGIELPPLDLSNVAREAKESGDSNPLLDAIRWALETPLVSDPVTKDGDYVYVSPVNLLSEVRKTGAFVLPTANAKGVRSLLHDQHHGEPVRRKIGDRQVRVIRVPLSEVE